MSGEVLVWECAAMPNDAPHHAAQRFVRESFDVERTIRWCKDSESEFFFSDSAWRYRIAVDFGSQQWRVYRTNKPTKAARERAKARREAKR